jgi:hypothetical protein
MNERQEENEMPTIAGLQFHRVPQSVPDVIELAQRVLPELMKRLPTEQDLYWFVIEQYDRLRGRDHTLDEMLDEVALDELEYEGMRSETSYVGKPNPGVVFLEEQVRKPLRVEMDEEATTYVLVAIYTALCSTNEAAVNALRRKYATHYHNNCVQNGHYNTADKWVAVLDQIG